MLMQVLSLTQDQINGLPPTERDAIQALVRFFSELFGPPIRVDWEYGSGISS